MSCVATRSKDFNDRSARASATAPSQAARIEAASRCEAFASTPPRASASAETRSPGGEHGGGGGRLIGRLGGDRHRQDCATGAEIRRRQKAAPEVDESGRDLGRRAPLEAREPRQRVLARGGERLQHEFVLASGEMMVERSARRAGRLQNFRRTSSVAAPCAPVRARPP